MYFFPGVIRLFDQKTKTVPISFLICWTDLGGLNEKWFRLIIWTTHTKPELKTMLMIFKGGCVFHIDLISTRYRAVLDIYTLY